ncbi:MAG: VOC family protein [Candidatus Omnitrophota bacterium]
MNLLIDIDVDDMDKGVKFYTQALGLQVGRVMEKGGTVELVGGSSRIYLLKNEEGSSPSKATSQKRTYKRHWTPVHFDVEVENIHGAVARAVKAGATIDKDIEKFPYGFLAVMADPFGHGFCFVQPTGRWYDEIADKL